MEPEPTRRDFVRLAGGATALTAAGGLGLLLQACGGSAGGGPAVLVEKDVSKLYAAAKKDGSVTWWTAHYEQEAADVMAKAFKTKYPGIEVSLLRQTAQVINTRLQQDLKSGVNDCDVFCSTDEGHYPPLKKAGALASYRPPDVDLIPKEFQTLDQDDQWHLGAVGFNIINFRSDKVTSPPKSWKDLLDPQWKGKITTGHPSFSGYVGQWVLAMIDKNGEQYLRDLAKNNPKINRSVNDTVTDLINGERLVGSGPDNFTLARKAKGNPVDILFPSDDAIAVPGPIGILSKSQHPNAARLFTNFIYSKEYSEALVRTSNYPLRPAIKPANGLPSLDKLKFYRNKLDRLVSGLPEAQAKWREIMGV